MGNGLKSKVSSGLSIIKQYWSTPPKGNYVPYKEIATLGGAGFGVHWASVLATTIGLDAANFLVGASIQLRPLHLSIMLIIANLAGIPIAFFRGWFLDNHKFPGGKFVPILLRTPIPIVALSALFVWLPYENWEYNTKLVVVWCMYMCIQFFYCFYAESWSFLQQIITPDAQERAKVMSISQIIYSLAPTLSNLIIPTVAGLTFGMNNIWTYRIIYPIFTVIGIIVLFIFMPKVKERIVLPKQKLEYINIFDSLREVCKNKYFWIINSAGWVGFLEGAYGAILGWSFVYAFNGEKQALLGVANTVIGNAALWSLMVVPFIIKWMGKRNLLIVHNVVNVLLLLLLLPLYNNLLLVVVIFYINAFINTFGNVYFMGIHADMRDYHQWKTGVRVDGLFGPMGTIGTIISFGTGLVIPAIYEHMGLKDDYNVLYDDTMRNNLFEVLIICSIIGAVLNLIPFLFYDLTEAKHRGYVNVLKIRAMFEDYGNGELDDGQLIEAMEIINLAKENPQGKKVAVDKTRLKAAKAMPKATDEEKAQRKEAIKKAKAEIKDIKDKNRVIESMPIVYDELNKFSTERYMAQLENAKKIVALGEKDFCTQWARERSLAKGLNKSLIRSDALKSANEKRRSHKLLRKVGYENLIRPDESVKEALQNKETKSLAERYSAYKELKKYSKGVSLYRRIVQPYESAKTLIIQAENYTHLAEIEALYSNAVAKNK